MKVKDPPWSQAIPGLYALCFPSDYLSSYSHKCCDPIEPSKKWTLHIFPIATSVTLYCMCLIAQWLLAVHQHYGGLRRGRGLTCALNGLLEVPGCSLLSYLGSQANKAHVKCQSTFLFLNLQGTLLVSNMAKWLTAFCVGYCIFTVTGLCTPTQITLLFAEIHIFILFCMMTWLKFLSYWLFLSMLQLCLINIFCLYL